MSSTDVLLNVATAARLFHASDGTGFADLIIDGHRETWPLRSKRFQAWIAPIAEYLSANTQHRRRVSQTAT